MHEIISALHETHNPTHEILNFFADYTMKFYLTIF